MGVPRRALCSQHWAGGKSSWDLGSRGVLAHPHASCSGYSLSPASGTLSPQGWSSGRSRSCHNTLLMCPDRGRRRCGQPGKGLISLAPGCRRSSLPSREQLVQGKGLIHSCWHPSLCRRLLSPYMVENEDTKSPRVTCPWFLLLGITFLQLPLPSPLQAASQSAAAAPAPTPFHLEVTLDTQQLMGRKRRDRRWPCWGQLTPHL